MFLAPIPIPAALVVAGQGQPATAAGNVYRGDAADICGGRANHCAKVLIAFSTA
jgi:hypothetical protein